MPETRVVAKLLATQAVTDLIGDRVRKHYRKSSWGSSDAITYQRIATVSSNHAGGTTTLSFVRLQVDIWSSTPLGGRALAQAVRDALSGWSDATGSPKVTMCHLMGEQDMPEPPDLGDEETETRIMQEYYLQVSDT
jgi:hypothetical protein